MWRICLLEGGIVPLVRRCVYHVYRPLYRRWTKCDKNEINSRLLERLDESWNEKLLAWKSDCAERGKWQMDVVWRHLLAVMNGWDWKMHIHQGLGSSFHIYLGRGKSRFGVTFQCIVARKNNFFLREEVMWAFSQTYSQMPSSTTWIRVFSFHSAVQLYSVQQGWPSIV